MLPTDEVRVLVDAQATLGEGPVWCELTQRLYFTDIEGATLHAWCAADGSHLRWPTPDRVGSLALCQAPDQLLLGLAGGVALARLPGAPGEPITTGPLLAVEADEPRTRINDGRCDAQGRFVFGTFNQAPGGEAIGHYWRVDGRSGSLQLEPLALPAVAVANCTAFSPDGTRLYFTDSPTRQVWCVAYPAEGPVGTPQPFATVPEGGGFPDGACVDAEGGLWCALWDGAAVLRWDARGRETHRIPLPVRRPTCPAFGGAALDTLFITSARAGLGAEALAAQPAAGALLAAPPGRWRGLPERRFITL